MSLGVGRVLTVSVMALAGAVMLAAAAQAQCKRQSFLTVVDEAAAKLRSLNQENKPAFQSRLRALKERRGWDHATFLKKAKPFVRDEQISAYDTQSQRLLVKISQLGDAGGAASEPDCAMLSTLREAMAQMVDIQTKKWAYMFARVDAALKR